LRDAVEAKKAMVHQLVESLSPDWLEAAEAMPERLGEAGGTVRLGGLCKNLAVDITDDDIVEARSEMWGQTGGA
jgi:hypothetical protein